MGAKYSKNNIRNKYGPWSFEQCSPHNGLIDFCNDDLIKFNRNKMVCSGNI